MGALTDIHSYEASTSKCIWLLGQKWPVTRPTASSATLWLAVHAPVQEVSSQQQGCYYSGATICPSAKQLDRELPYQFEFYIYCEDSRLMLHS